MALSPPLHALVGPTAVVTALARRWAEARVVDLPQGLALVPLTDALLDDLAEVGAASPRIGHVRQPPVPDGVALVACEATASRDGGPGAALAWVRRNGDTAAAVVWEGGRVVLGPLTGDGGTDAALHRVGAWTRPEASAVDALGLRWAGTDALALRGTSPFEPGR